MVAALVIVVPPPPPILTLLPVLLFARISEITSQEGWMEGGREGGRETLFRANVQRLR